MGIWSDLRADFPNTKNSIYLDHASASPIPRPVQEAYNRYASVHATEADFSWPQWMKRREAIRRKIAKWIHASPDEITFTTSTSHGMNLIAELIAHQGKVLTNHFEFPSSTVPWIWRKAKMIYQDSQGPVLSLADLKKKLEPKVKTILTSYVQYGTGFKQDLKKIGAIKGDRYLVVNATQGLGATDINVQENQIDFLCTNSYKWLMAGYGGGFLYINRKWLKAFAPSSIGWRSMRDPEAMDNQSLDISPHANRYEWGCPGFPNILALGASIDYLTGIGLDKINRRILKLTDFVIECAQQNGFEVMTPKKRSQRCGIVVFKVKEPKKKWHALLKKRIYVSPRGEGIRIAPHFYNTFEEIETAITALKKA